MAKSRRALHWVEAKHPRDNRGRFAEKGGGKWLARVGEQAKAAFGDVSMGYRPGEGPQGRLQTGKGGLIDTAAISRKAPRMHGPEQPPQAQAATKRPEFLKVGERFKNAQGVEHEVVGVPSAGRRAGKQVSRVKVRRIADDKIGPVTLEGPVEMVEQGGVEAPKVGRTATGTIDTPRVLRQSGGMTNSDGANFADDLRKEMGSQNDLAKETARGGRTPAGAKLPTTRTGSINPKPARDENRAVRTGRTATGEKVEGPELTGVDRVMKARSNTEKAAAFKALTSDEIVEAFQRDPGKALDAYMQKNFGKGSGRENALPPAVGNIAANLKSGEWTPDRAAEQMRQWARLHAGMQHQRYMHLAADLTDGTVAKRRGAAGKGNADGGNVETPKTPEVRRHQTFSERMAGDMSEADRRAAHAEGDRRRAELRAQEAEQARLRAEAEANDTRSEREKLTQKLQDAYTMRDIGMRSGRLDPKREAAIKAAEARLAVLKTEDSHAKIKEFGIAKGDKVKTPLGEFEVTGVTKEGTLRVVRPDGRKGGVDPKNVESVTKSPAAQEKAAAARDRKIASLEKKVLTLQGRVGMAKDRRTSSGSRIQSGAESKANAQLATARFELHELQRQKSMEGEAGSGRNADGGNVDKPNFSDAERAYLDRRSAEREASAKAAQDDVDERERVILASAFPNVTKVDSERAGFEKYAGQNGRSYFMRFEGRTWRAYDENDRQVASGKNKFDVLREINGQGGGSPKAEAGGGSGVDLEKLADARRADTSGFGHTSSGRRADATRWDSRRLSQLGEGDVIVRTEQREDNIVGVVDRVEHLPSGGAIVHYKDGTKARKARGTTMAVARDLTAADVDSKFRGAAGKA